MIRSGGTGYQCTLECHCNWCSDLLDIDSRDLTKHFVRAIEAEGTAADPALHRFSLRETGNVSLSSGSRSAMVVRGQRSRSSSFPLPQRPLKCCVQVSV